MASPVPTEAKPRSPDALRLPGKKQDSDPGSFLVHFAQ